jgi:SOUL heme-binding protein
VGSSSLLRPLTTAIALVASQGCATVTGVKEPTFAVEAHERDFEIRRYETRVVAETRIVGTRKDADTEGFRRLAGYIFGANRQKTKLAMTAPVGQDAEPRKLAMTAPVGQRAEGEAWTVSFTMPGGETLATLPEPEDARVTLRELPESRFAVVKFSGRWTEASFAANTAALREWLAGRGLPTAGAAQVNRYDPPWTPWFMRRNEVWVSLAEPPDH